MTNKLKFLRTLLVVALLLLVLAGVIFYFAQSFFAYPGRGLYAGGSSEWYAGVAALSGQGMVQKEFATPSGVVKGIWAPGGPGAYPAILWIHARTQTCTQINQNLTPLTAAGFHVFAMEYRGYGASPGESGEAALLSDAEASVDWLAEKDDVAGRRVYVGGLELGGNLALKVAARKRVAAVIAVNPLPDLASAIVAKAPFIPIGFLLKDAYALDSVLPAVSAPVLLVRGSGDPVLTAARAEAMVGKIPVRARIREVPGAGQFDALERGGRELIDEIDVFKDTLR